MIPTVTRQLQAIRRRLTESVVPELPPDAAFAHEQVALIGAALDLLIECHEHEYRYAVLENHDYRVLLGELAALAGGGGDESAALLAEDGPTPRDGALTLDAVTAQSARMKALVERLHSGLADDPEHAGAATRLLAAVAATQVEREASWYRAAGFTADAPPIADRLAGAARGGAA
jgi:hypothetical protein